MSEGTLADVARTSASRHHQGRLVASLGCRLGYFPQQAIQPEPGVLRAVLALALLE